MWAELSGETLLQALDAVPGYGFAVVAIAALALLVLNEWINPGRRFRRRLAVIGAEESPVAVGARATRRRGRRAARPSGPRDPDLQRAMGLALVAAAIVSLALLFVGAGLTLALPIALVVGGVIGLVHRRRLRSKRLAVIAAEFPTAIDTMVRSLRSGLTLSDTFRLIAEEAPPAIAAEFRRIETEREIGLSLPEVMTRLANRIDLQEIRYFVTIVNLQSVTGSSLADTLGTLGETLRQRRILKDKIDSMTADARSSAMIIGALPFVVIAALVFVNPGYLAVFYTTGAGLMILISAILYMIVGFAVMREMVKFDA